MVIAAMIAAVLGMAVFDAMVSAKRMKRLGASVELNPLARVVFVKFGRKGLLVLLIGMSGVVGGLAAAISPLLLAGFVGFRAALLVLQLRSLQFDPPELP